MEPQPAPDPPPLPFAVQQRIDTICVRFEEAWRDGPGPPLEEFLGGVPEPERPHLFRELLPLEVEMRQRRGDLVRPDTYLQRFPEYADLIARLVPAPGDQASTIVRAGAPAAASASAADTLRLTDPPAGLADAFRAAGYEVLAELGRGGMGLVYKARQVRLNRLVALKVIRGGALSGPEDALRFQLEGET